MRFFDFIRKKDVAIGSRREAEESDSECPVIQDEDTVGGSEDERILVRHCPSMIDENRRVYKIVFDE